MNFKFELGPNNKKAVKQGRSPTLYSYLYKFSPYFSHNKACCHTIMNEVGIKFALEWLQGR